ncbi:MAG: cyclic nucleotide-binding domain-containing protein [Dehalococcoidia bacterium]|nr:MAG: cyclic nucleotide-binding domain-containing protein [Dehalococcoidia bacterium]
MEIQNILQRIDMFSGLSKNEKDLIAELCQPRDYKVNEVIFEEKSKGTEMFIVARGRIRIELRVKSKTDCVTVHRLRDGDVFGEIAIVSEAGRSGTAICETDCELITISRNALLKLFDEHPRIGYIVMTHLASVLATRLRKTDLQLVACYLWE